MADIFKTGGYNPPSWPNPDGLDGIEYQVIQPKLNPMCAHNFVPSSLPHKDNDGNWIKYPALCSRCGKWSKE